jgi:hypothetical protein
MQTTDGQANDADVKQLRLFNVAKVVIPDRWSAGQGDGVTTMWSNAWYPLGELDHVSGLSGSADRRTCRRPSTGATPSCSPEASGSTPHRSAPQRWAVSRARDPTRDDAHELLISEVGTSIAVLVVPTDEEGEIARQTAAAARER